MPDVETDRHEFTITIIAHGNLQISNVSVPATGYTDEQIIINYDVTNNGGQDTCFGKVMDGDTVMHRWDDTINAGATVNRSHIFNIPQVGQKELVIIVGYNNG